MKPDTFYETDLHKRRLGKLYKIILQWWKYFNLDFLVESQVPELEFRSELRFCILTSGSRDTDFGSVFCVILFPVTSPDVSSFNDTFGIKSNIVLTSKGCCLQYRSRWSYFPPSRKSRLVLCNGKTQGTESKETERIRGSDYVTSWWGTWQMGWETTQKDINFLHIKKTMCAKS